MKHPKANFTFYLAFEMRRIHNAHFYSRIFYDFNLSKKFHIFMIKTVTVGIYTLMINVYLKSHCTRKSQNEKDRNLDICSVGKFMINHFPSVKQYVC